MNNIWRWIIGIAVGLVIVALIFGGGSNRADYWIARGDVPRAIQVIHAEDITLIHFPCHVRAGSIESAKECSFYVWKK